MQCLQAYGEPVTQATLRQKLGRANTSTDAADNALHATIYRLRRRIEKATPMGRRCSRSPRVGYVFKAKFPAGLTAGIKPAESAASRWRRGVPPSPPAPSRRAIRPRAAR